MRRVKVKVESKIKPSFRVDQVSGIFDCEVGEKSALSWEVELPDNDGDWKIGAIVGASGSGKSTIAKKAYGKALVEGFKWPRDKAMIDGFGDDVEFSEIGDVLNAVGFSEPPAWVRPYRVLSGGQRFRADLARALLSGGAPGIGGRVLAFDEFTSVVDRQVGRFGSAAVAKAVRRGASGGARIERFVAVTCHEDVLDWLEPDWVLHVRPGGGELMHNGGASARRWVRRGIQIDVRKIRRGHPRNPRKVWETFKHHHYLSGDLHPAARCYVAVWEGREVAFCATLMNAGHKGRRMVHRLVVLPDFQGMGIGLRLLDAVVKVEAVMYRMTIRTSHPALIGALNVRKGWRLKAKQGIGGVQMGFSAKRNQRVGAGKRCVATFEWVGG